MKKIENNFVVTGFVGKDSEKSSPAFASKGGEGTKHSFLTVTVFPAVGHISVPSLAVTPSLGIPPLIRWNYDFCLVALCDSGILFLRSYRVPCN